MNKRVGVIAAVVVAAVAGGLWGYPALREFKFEKDFTRELRQHQRAALEKARLIETDAEQRDFETWYIGGTRELIAARWDTAPPKGREMLRAVGAITEELHFFSQRCYNASDSLALISERAPAKIAKAEDAEATIERIESAYGLMVNFEEHLQQSRERLRVLVSTSGADEETRIMLWQSVAYSFEKMAKTTRLVGARTGQFKAYLDVLHFLRSNREGYYVAVNGTVMFSDIKLLEEYQKKVSTLRWGR